MKFTLRYLATVFLFILSGMSIINAQRAKIETSKGTAQIRVEENVTKEDARRKVEQMAIIDAITNAFGQYVEQESILTVQSGKSRFNIIGTTKVKGEWVETIDKSFEEDSRDEKGQFGTVKTLWITCNIKGRVKEATPKANIEYQTLSYPNMNSRSTTINSGEKFFLYFRSPVNGFLSVFLDDGNKISRLLPYNSMSSFNAVNVEADREYIFFSFKPEHEYFKNLIPDAVYLSTSNESEINTVHIIFSEEKYFKPGLEKIEKMEDMYIPQWLSRKDFETWLADNKTVLEDFIDAQISVEILGER